MTSTLRNFGGVDFTNLSTTIECSDPYITITDNAGYFGYLAVDSTAENIGDPYVISADASTPNGHVAGIQLIATEGAFADTFEFCITIGTYHYLVWNPDPTPMSGQRIDSILTALGYTGIQSTALLAGDPIDVYEAIFVCVGIYSYNHIIGASSPEALALVDYINNGGNVYLEGGDVWYFDPPSGYNFGPLFGIQPLGDGSGDLFTVAGTATTFTEGMSFGYSGENSYIDHLRATGTGFSILRNAANTDTVGVANDAGTHKTVGTSFELGGLVDGTGVSTKAALLDSIMHFFGINLTAVEEITELGVKKATLSVVPNPFSTFTDIRYQIIDNSKAELKIFDISGRLVKNLSQQLSAIGDQLSVMWNGTDGQGRRLPAGIYFVRLNTENHAETQKIILVE
ncbi:hypothetical protein AMJ83_00375 [candidate division WOR_3 bacterium SM23_42]|uniref:Secretion system C-terminal sorting domain-containing protein n=1 Tax=candidate division WOR_3 bacterium SM23_42 TaxID=1703779 RepID=A0A0S8FXM6_UNCW3|nr:MAG: hypothetical protein AMJ83_00375 [candidate division WOR_3 bacterium SM23_42]